MSSKNRRTLTLTTAPAAEPLLLAEVKAWAKIDSSDDDALLASLLTAAINAAENYTKRAFITQSWTLSLDLCSSDAYNNLGDGVYDLPVTALYNGLSTRISLPKQPIQSITSVTTYDIDNADTVYESSYYSLINHALVLKSTASWPSGLRVNGAVEIVFVAGYGDTSADVPAPIKTAILMHVQQMYDERTFCEMPENCKQLLMQYRIMDGLNA